MGISFDLRFVLIFEVFSFDLNFYIRAGTQKKAKRTCTREGEIILP